MPPTNEALTVLSVDPDIVPFDFSSGVEALDSHHIMIDKLGLILRNGNQLLSLCVSCYNAIQHNFQPPESLANFRWIGPLPKELEELNWLEEILIARAHCIGRIVRLQERKESSFFALKGHTILLPQDTTHLLNILPMSPASLVDEIRVIWVGKSAPKRSGLMTHFKVRTQKVYDALCWLCKHHEDYKDVTIDENEFAGWPSPVFFATDLMDSVGRIADPSAEDASRSGFALEDPDMEGVEGDLPITTSAIIDVSRVSESPNAVTLKRLVELKNEITINVVNGSSVLNDYVDGKYFTSAFPILFPWGTGKHIDRRREQQLSLSTWTCLLLKHSSRFVPST